MSQSESWDFSDEQEGRKYKINNKTNIIFTGSAFIELPH